MNNKENGKNKRKIDDEKKRQNDEFEELYREMPLTSETTCGYGFCSGPFLQKFANKKIYIILYGLAGCCFSSSFAYFNGTISTIEKRFKIPSRNTGIITIGNDISQMLASVLITYYASKGHKPRWISVGLLLIASFCALTAIPHLIYGAGEDSLALTKEHGAILDENETLDFIEMEKKKILCNFNDTLAVKCDVEEGNLAPQVILFCAQLVSGVGSALYGSLGVIYMDDNVKRSKSPAILSLTFFLRMIGPALGYALASYCLKWYISPHLTPTITMSDPRWVGAWWLGWLVISVELAFIAVLIGLYPKTLPRAAVRRQLAILKANEEKLVKQKEQKEDNANVDDDEEDELPASISDMIQTLKRLFKNKILMLNNVAGILYMFGFTPYWIFTPKYMESQYKKTASSSNIYTGTIAFVFTAIGVLSSGIIISKYKPSARKMAAWNVIVGLFTTIGYFSYTQLGCEANDKTMIINTLPLNNSNMTTCNSNCNCDYVKYSPVCGEDGNSYISACHAGCTEQESAGNSTQKIYSNCSCIGVSGSGLGNSSFNEDDKFSSMFIGGGGAVSGPCEVDCSREFIMFLSVLCFLKFLGSTGMATNFLVGVRCVKEKDKTVSMGLGLAMASLFAFIPSPIFFGAILDSTCALWGKTCSGTGNCWLYDGPSLRFLLNTIASSSIALATLFDLGVWYYVKDLVVFEKKDKKKKITDNDDGDDETMKLSNLQNDQ